MKFLIGWGVVFGAWLLYLVVVTLLLTLNGIEVDGGEAWLDYFKTIIIFTIAFVSGMAAAQEKKAVNK